MHATSFGTRKPQVQILLYPPLRFRFAHSGDDNNRNLFKAQPFGRFQSAVASEYSPRNSGPILLPGAGKTATAATEASFVCSGYYGQEHPDLFGWDRNGRRHPV